MRSRDLTRLTAASYDLLVVGGGIHGLTIAYEAASRGLRTALVDAGDFGGGTSFNHQKTVHGGLRSLQSASLRRARESILERRALARIAPWFLRPLPFIVGTYRSATRGRLAFRAAFRLDRWLGRDRNVGVEPELHLPAARLVSKAATLRLFSGVRPESADRRRAVVRLPDGRGRSADARVRRRCRPGGCRHRQLRRGADAAARPGDRISGMTVRDVASGDTFAINASVTVNAAGAHAGTIMQAFGVSRRVPLLKAMNLVTSRPASDIALAAPTAAGQMLTLVPWRGRAIIGTGQSKTLVAPDATGVTAAEVDAFIAEANQAFPALRLTRDDVTLVHRGIVPAVEGPQGAPTLLSTPIVYDHAADRAAGAMTVIGVKYTTARRVAQTGDGARGEAPWQAPRAIAKRRPGFFRALASRITKRWRSKRRARSTSSCRLPPSATSSASMPSAPGISCC